MVLKAADRNGPIVVWIGRFTTTDGYGTAALAHVSALRDHGAEVVSVEIDSQSIVGPVRDGLIRSRRRGADLEIRAADPDRDVVAIVHDRPDLYGRVTASGRSRLIGFSYWETNDLPAEWAGWMASMDRVWAASSFNADAFERAGVPAWMIDVVGHPVDPLVLDAAESTKSYRMRWPHETVFLSLVSSMNRRRDLGVLFEAFAAAFTSDDDVALVLKAPDGTEEAVRSLLSTTMNTMPARPSGSWPTVYVVAEDLSREQLVRLHGSVDCYVSCERGDGWDLPAMDSLVLGVPVVSTDFGASSTFLDEADCFVVPTDGSMISADAMLTRRHPLYTGQFWPYLDPARLAEQLTLVHRDPARRVAAGRAAAVRLRERFDRTRIAENLAALIETGPRSDVRSNRDAAIRISRASSGWRVRFHHTVAESPDVAEARLLNMLAPRRLASAAMPGSPHVGLPGAIEFARTHRTALRSTPTGAALGRLRAATQQAPGASLFAAARTMASFPALSARFTDVGGTDRLVDIADEYLAALDGRVTERDPVAIESDRQVLWSFAGPFKSPTADLARLRDLRNRHAGERVFILGNGPSLTECNLSLLADEFTFGVNKIHLLFDRIDWRPDFYTLLDWKIGAALVPHVAELDGSLKFFPERFRGVLPADDMTFWYWPRPVGRHVDDQFEPDMANGIPSRATVLVTAIQQAFHMGFRDIILIGVDASYSIPDTVKQAGDDRFNTGVKLHLESTENDDPNHFDPRYFGAGARWHDPNVDDMIRMFRLMRKGVERHGGRLLNATVGGALEELPRVDYRDLF
jgi:glycosyltransferase involved in cell wall biosynthesis